MDLTARTAAAVDDELDRLRTAYGPLDPVETRRSLPPAEHGEVVERVEAGTIGGAGAWIRDEAGRALVVRHPDDDGWVDPGGKDEPGERLEETAVREAREETGVECRIVDLVSVHRVRYVCADRPSLHRLIAIFDARYVSGEPRPQPGEIAAVRWVTEPPEIVGYPAVETYRYGPPE
ncbi:NUDIX hydrolase [Haloferacaceae archaeon DSL9]